MLLLNPDDLARCETILREGSRSFHAASRLLPRRVRLPATALYAFCRSLDDLIDAKGATSDALDTLRERVARSYEGRPFNAPVDRAFTAVTEHFAIPRALPEALLEGFAWDASGRTYQSLDDVQAYAARVAGTVGVMMTLLMGSREPNVLARACDLGVAMQLTNIARDVGEDAAQGRVYLPRQWLTEAGINPEEWLERPIFHESIGSVVARLLDAADALYRRSDYGVAMLPSDCRIAIAAARLIYSDIGRRITRARYDSVTQRAVVSKARKLWLLFRAFVGRHPVAPPAYDPPIEPVRFLVEAVVPRLPHPLAPSPKRGEGELHNG